MKKLWDANTFILASQVAVGGLIYASISDVGLAVLGATAVAVGIVYVASLVVGDSAFFYITVSVFTTTILVVVTAQTFHSSVATGLLLIVALVATLISVFEAVEKARKEGATEPKPALFLAALPLGIGTVFGGLLYLFKYRNKVAVKTGQSRASE